MSLVDRDISCAATVIPSIAVLPSTPTSDIVDEGVDTAPPPSPNPLSRKNSKGSSREGTPILSLGKDAVKGVLLSKHSFATIGKRKGFSRKPSSWRHPGGTVSETEETDFSEYETDAEAGSTGERSKHGREEKKGPRHVHSFTFSSLSRFRSKYSEKNSKEELSRQNCQEEESSGGKIEVKRITSPARSPNRKLREATDRVGDKLRAYAQKFKESSKHTDKDRLEGKRSSSTGRTDTIQEESTEEIEADRIGVGISRTQSLITRTNNRTKIEPKISPLELKKFKRKPKETEESSISPPSTSKTEAKKDPEIEAECQSKSESEISDDHPHISVTSGESFGHDDDVSDDDESRLTADESSSVTVCYPIHDESSIVCYPIHEEVPPVFPITEDTPAVFPIREEIPAVFISEIDDDTINSVGKHDIEELVDDDLPTLDPIIEQDIEGKVDVPEHCGTEINEALLKQLIGGGATGSSPQPITERYRKSLSETPEPCSERGHYPHHIPSSSPSCTDPAYMQPPQGTVGGCKHGKYHGHRRSGHGSRPGSKKKRRKQDQLQESRHLHKSEEKDIVPRASSGPVRSASLTSLGTTVRPTEEERSNLSLSPPVSTVANGPRLLGSSTLPRSSSQNRSTDEGCDDKPNIPSVLSLQLEGVYGGQNVCDTTTWREDTLSPSTTRSTGFAGESTETLMNIEDCLLEPMARKLSDSNPPRSQLLFPDLMKAEDDIAEMSETEGSADHVTIEAVPPPPPEVSQSTISNWLTAQALDNMSENNRTRLEEDIETADIAHETVELLQEDIKSPLFGGQQFIIPDQLNRQEGKPQQREMLEQSVTQHHEILGPGQGILIAGGTGQAVSLAGVQTVSLAEVHTGQSVGLGLPMMPPSSTGLLSGGQGRPGDMLEAGILSGGQGKPGDFLFYSQDGNQVKVAQVIEILGETAKETKGPQDAERLASMVDVGCDAEVAQLTCRNSHVKAFEGGLPTDSPQNRARTLTQAPPADQEDLGDVKLVVQSFDPQMPELTWEDTWQAGGHQQDSWPQQQGGLSIGLLQHQKSIDSSASVSPWKPSDMGKSDSDIGWSQGQGWQEKFFIERVPSKDTDSTCSLTLSQGEQSEDSASSLVMGKPSLDGKCWPETFSPDSANSWMRLTNQKLGPDIWQELSAVQSPENTIFSASTMKTKERNTILEMEWNPRPEKPKRADWSDDKDKGSDWSDDKEKKSDWQMEKERGSVWTDSRGHAWQVSEDDWILSEKAKPRKGAEVINKAATFPRTAQRGGASKSSETNIAQQQRKKSTVEGDMAMKKQMLQKLAAQKEQEDLKSSPTRCLQRKMCKSDHESKGFKLPEGFVTPVRSTPIRNNSNSQYSKRISTRQALRGPFGELLMEEMAKPSSLKSIQPAQFPALVSVGSGALCTVTTYTSDASCHTTLAQIRGTSTDSESNLITSASNSLPSATNIKIGVTTTGLLQTTACLLSTAAHTSSICTPKHQRTRSSPSRIEYDQLAILQPAKLTTQIVKASTGEPVDTLQGGQMVAMVSKDLQGGQMVPARVSKDLLINRIEQGGNSAFRVIKDTRALIVREVLQVEKTYVESLQILIMKYMNPLKNPANAFSLESNLVEDIFYQIPTILEHHEGFLEDLKGRLENWDPNQTIGDWFIQSFSKKSVLETYTCFIRNVKKADDAIRLARSLKPAFERFLQDMRRERRGERLSLSDLLAKPHQRIPRYRLLIQRLLKHTDESHEDYGLLQQAERQIHELALKISTVEKEATEQEIRQGILRQLEVLVHGLGPGDLANPHRMLIRQDLVTSATTAWMRKERCVFLLTDLLLITTVNRRGTRSSKEGKKSFAGMNSLIQILETCRHKLWMYLSIKDVEIGKDEMKKGVKESEGLEEDIKVLHSISEQLNRLSNPHRDIEEMVKSSMSTLQKQLMERQSLDGTRSGDAGSCLNLSIHTAEGPETIGLVFDSTQAKLEWEEEFTKCKEKLEIQADPPPNLLTLIPIRKTRAGLQFTSASPTLSLNSHGMKDVWVCNSDGYVGQVCVLSVRPEPSVICCNGVCNARIQSIASVPGDSSQCMPWTSQSSLLRKDWPSWSAPTTPAAMGWMTPPSSSSCTTTGVSDTWASKSWTVNSETGTADSSPRSGGLGGQMLDISSEDEEDNISLRNSQYLNRPDSQGGATMWLGTEDGTIHVYNCTDNIRLKKNKEKFFHSSPVIHILYHEDKVYVSLGNGEVIIYSRDNGVWDKSGCVIKSVGNPTYPVTRMCVVMGAVWCATHNTIKRLDPVNHTVMDVTTLNADPRKSIICMELSGIGLWLVQQGSAVVHLYNIKSRTYLLELNVVTTVTRLLSGCDDIIRQHKTACLRVTTILPVKDTIWIGTSAGAIVTATLPQLTETTTKLQTIPQITGIPHGHTGHVRFLTCVEVGPAEAAGSIPGTPGSRLEDRLGREASIPEDSASPVPAKFHQSKDKQKGTENMTNHVLVISGGDGYEDFTNSASNDMAGREDSTNHLLLWSI